jgi:hypothetical protein
MGRLGDPDHDVHWLEIDVIPTLAIPMHHQLQCAFSLNISNPVWNQLSSLFGTSILDVGNIRQPRSAFSPHDRSQRITGGVKVISYRLKNSGCANRMIGVLRHGDQDQEVWRNRERSINLSNLSDDRSGPGQRKWRVRDVIHWEMNTSHIARHHAVSRVSRENTPTYSRRQHINEGNTWTIIAQFVLRRIKEMWCGKQVLRATTKPFMNVH